jgi:hypothetical protein
LGKADWRANAMPIQHVEIHPPSLLTLRRNQGAAHEKRPFPVWLWHGTLPAESGKRKAESGKRKAERQPTRQADGARRVVSCAIRIVGEGAEKTSRRWRMIVPGALPA